jgi:hypothetical protein
LENLPTVFQNNYKNPEEKRNKKGGMDAKQEKKKERYL